LILADTSIWIEYLREKSPYKQILRRHLEQGNIVTTAAIFGELLQGASSQKDADRILSYFNALPQVESDGSLWIEAGLLSFSKKAKSRGIGLIDIAIICSARRQGALIWSRDKGLLTLLAKEEKFHAKK